MKKLKYILSKIDKNTGTKFYWEELLAGIIPTFTSKIEDAKIFTNKKEAIKILSRFVGTIEII